MDELDLPTPAVDVETVSPRTLHERIEDGQPVTLLDTRMESEYRAWQIEGPTVTSINIPYFQFLDDDVDPSLLSELPADRPIIVLCAKGGASEFVAARLTDLGYEVSHLVDGMRGWARLYDSVPVTRYAGSGTVIQYQRPSSGCLGYLIADGGEAAVIDPLRAFTDRYIADADALGVDITYAIDTHVHADHLSGVRDLMAAGSTGILSAAAVARGVTYAEGVTVLEAGDELSVGSSTIRAVATPGHTSGSTSFLIDGSFLATGDSLFVESVARPDLEAGDEGAPEAAAQLYESLNSRIRSLPGETVIGGAHFSPGAEAATDGTYTARLDRLVIELDAFAMDQETFVEWVLGDMPPRPANYEAIIDANLGVNDLDDDAAFELELGPNNCAASRDSMVGD